MNPAHREPDEDPEQSALHGGGELGSLRRENELLRTEIEAVRRFLESMQEMIDAVETPRRDDEVMDLLADVLRNALATINAKDASLLVLDEETDELVFVLIEGDVDPQRLAWRRLPIDEGIAGWVARNAKPTIVNNPREDDRFYNDLDSELDFATRSILAVPLIGDGKVLGVVEVLNKHDGQLFSTQDQRLMTLICRFAGELLNSILRRSQLARANR